MVTDLLPIDLYAVDFGLGCLERRFHSRLSLDLGQSSYYIISIPLYNHLLSLTLIYIYLRFKYSRVHTKTAKKTAKLGNGDDVRNGLVQESEVVRC